MVKKILTFALMLSFVLFMIPNQSQAQTSIGLVVNGRTLDNLPTPPVIRDGNMLVPARAVFESLGAVVLWQEETRSVYIQYRDRDIVVTIDQTDILVNGWPGVPMPVPAQIINGNTMIPMRAVAVNLGFIVDFRDNTAFVDSPPPEEPPEQEPEDIIPPDLVIIPPEEPPEYPTEPEEPELPIEPEKPNFDYPVTEHPEEPIEPYEPELDEPEPDEPGLDEPEPDEPELDEPEPGEPELDESETQEGQQEEQDGQEQEGQEPTEPVEILPPLPPSVNRMPISTWILPARDLSVIEIPYVSHPPTTIVDLTMPTPFDQPVFIIRASSPITAVDRMLLEDNRLVLDFPNSTTLISGAFSGSPMLPVSEVRVSQQYTDSTRVVFDLQDGIGFTVSMTYDRMAVMVTIVPEVLEGIYFEAGNGYDLVFLRGINPSALRIQPREGVFNIHLTNAHMNVLGDFYAEDGGFVNQASASIWSPITGLVVLHVNDFTAYTLIHVGVNETIIRLQPATYRNIHYDFNNRTFRIPRTDGFAIDTGQIRHSDLYHQQRYTLHLPINAHEHLGFGEFVIADHLLTSMQIVHMGGVTELVFNGTQIIALDMYENDYYYFIRIMHPREKYPRIVVIDPGHGGIRPGAVRGGVRESDLNLAVTRKLIQLLERDGFIRAYTTRNSDINLAPDNSTDLGLRPAMGNAVGDVFLSIHHNASTNLNANGVETYYFATVHDQFRNFSSRNFADILQRHKLSELGSNDRGVISRNFAVLRYSTIPAALVELGFMSNTEELARITTTEFQWQAAHALNNALRETFIVYTPPR